MCSCFFPKNIIPSVFYVQGKPGSTAGTTNAGTVGSGTNAGQSGSGATSSPGLLFTVQYVGKLAQSLLRAVAFVDYNKEIY